MKSGEVRLQDAWQSVTQERCVSGGRRVAQVAGDIKSLDAEDKQLTFFN